MGGVNPFRDWVNPHVPNEDYREERLKIAQEEERLKKLQDVEYFVTTQIPELYKDVDEKKLHIHLKAFLTDANQYCWISGGVGTGKTYNLYTLKKYQLLNNLEPIKVIKEIKLTHETNVKGFIAIDDVGLSKNPNRLAHLIELYFSIVEEKHEAKKKIIFTSNYSLSEWLESMKLYNADIVFRLGSRLSKKTLQIKLDGEDKRKI